MAELTTSSLFEPLQLAKASGLSVRRALHRLGLRRPVDLVFHFPRDYEEAVAVIPVDQFQTDERVSFIGTVVGLDERISQSGKHMLGAEVRSDDGGSVRLLWFNQPFRKKILQPGCRLRATGVVRSTVLNWEIVQPSIAFVDDGESTADCRPLPIYPLSEGLKQSQLRQVMRDQLPAVIPLVEEVLPDSLRNELDVIGIGPALQALHFPRNDDDIQMALRRFKLQEFLVLQLAISLQRQDRVANSRGLACEPTGKIHSRILNRLGFRLTKDQETAIQEVGKDMAAPIPMNRLLQGDVGSGKTVVAQYAMLLCVAHGYQAALMAPTEVLAQQHARNLEKSLSASRVRVALLTGTMPRTTRQELLKGITAGDVDLVIGTQALLSNDVKFNNLALVIVDEQHKFGVRQRAKLRTEAAQPHYLVLSATPIPRTIAMTAFGDLDVSTLHEKPPGRAAVHSYTATRDELPSWYRFVEEKLTEGRQAFVIAPRVDSTNEVAGATQVYEQLRNQEFARRTVGLLHGKLDSAEKDRVLSAFADGHIDLLVATTVVEVGIDVANATVMTILDADRLGLAQLHQLRGRIARGTQPGFVCAVTSANCDVAENERLAAFQKSDDGFELAEQDLALRGPGDLLGTSQSGLPKLRIADLVSDASLLEVARQVARDLLHKDPGLQNAEYARLRKQTVSRYGAFMQLSDVG